MRDRSNFKIDEAATAAARRHWHGATVFAHGRVYACVTKIGTKPESFVVCFNAGCKQTLPEGGILWETFCCKTDSPIHLNLGAPASPPATTKYLFLVGFPPP